MARHAPPGVPAHLRADHRVVTQGRVHGDGVGVEIEQPAATLHRGREVTKVLEPELGAHVIGDRCEGDDAPASWQRQCAAIRRAVDRFHAGYRAVSEEANKAVTGEQLAQPQAERLVARQPRQRSPRVAGRHVANGVVERRMLAKPAAATGNGSSVVSISARAV
jgi:hypothetical protein